MAKVDVIRALSVIAACEHLIEHFLPGRFARDGWSCDLKVAQTLLTRTITQALNAVAAPNSINANEISEAFFERLDSLEPIIQSDIQAAYDGDPAALSHAEIIAAYPGILAVTTQRLAHELYKFQVPIIPRIMTEWAHSISGADVHPAAEIGSGFFMDHCTGIVVGATAVVGNNVKMYQGATLGAKSFSLDENGNPVKGVRRHPTVEDNVVIYANAVILGGDTVIGAGSIIGAGTYLTESVPPGSIVGMKRPELRVFSNS